MIIQAQVPDYIGENLPEIKSDLQKAVGANAPTVYTAVKCLTDFTRVMVQDHNYPMVRRCLSLAGKLYTKGNDAVKNALENVYVFSFSSLLTGCESFQERNLLQAAIPGSLYQAYMKQVTAFGI